jgi:hypothetical protein
MSLRSSVLTGLVATALLVSAYAEEPSPPASPDDVAERRAFLVCDSEGGLALAIARNYFLSGRKEEQVLPYVGDKQPGLGLAQKLFRESAAGKVSHHADFATEVLFECASREGLALDKPNALVRMCFARVDIPFFLQTLRRRGVEKGEAITRLETMLKDRDIYPESMIQATAQSVYSDDAGSDANKLMGTVFWSCVYPSESRHPS